MNDEVTVSTEKKNDSLVFEARQSTDYKSE